MPLYVAFTDAGGYGGNVLPIEVGTPRVSEIMSATGVSANTVVGDEIVSVVASEDGWVVMGAGTPSAAASPRFRILSGMRLSFNGKPGDKVAWASGA